MRRQRIDVTNLHIKPPTTASKPSETRREDWNSFLTASERNNPACYPKIPNTEYLVTAALGN